MKLKTTLLLTTMIGLISGCGNFKSFDYTGSGKKESADNGNSGDAEGKAPEMKEPGKEVKQPSEPIVIKKPEEPQPGEETKPMIIDTAFDTGTPQCVENKIVEEFGSPFRPYILDETLDDYLTKEVKTYNDFQTLADLILREVVDTDGLIDYGRLRTDLSVQWKKVANTLPNGDILANFRTSEEDKMAFWSNIYNLKMIDLVVKNPNVARSLDLPGKDGALVFDTPFELAGITMTLNQLEKGILGVGEPGDPAKERNFNGIEVKELEPRLHFTVVCGALSCPKLRNFLYRPEHMKKVLRENSLIVANTAGFFRPFLNKFDEVEMWANPLFDQFYPTDFEILYGKNWVNLPNFFLDECRTDKNVLKDVITDAEESGEGIFFAVSSYNWLVNDVTNRPKKIDLEKDWDNVLIK